MQTSVNYVHAAPESALPDIAARPSRMIVVLETAVSSAWQNLVSDWIVDSGCLYMMAWGVDCSSWDDAVDWANLARFDFGDIPDDQSVMTTWHENASLDEVFWYAQACAGHPTVDLAHTVILHISASDRREELLCRYAAAGTDTSMD